MVKLLKIFGWLIAILVVLVVVVTLLAMLLIDPNEHKDRIVSEVRQATGRDLSIGGDIGLSVFPWLGLELSQLSLSNAPGFRERQFASVDLAKVRVKLMPLLLDRTLEADTIQIKGLDLYLAKNEEGRGNWEDLAAGQAQANEAETEGHGPDRGPGLAAFTIGGVAIQDAHVIWDDRSSGQHYEIKRLQLETGPLSLGEPVKVDLELMLESQQPPLQGRVELDGTLNSRPEQQYFAVESLELDLDVTGEGLPEEGLEATLQGNVYVDLGRGSLEMKELTLTSGDLTLRAALQGQELQTEPRFTGTLKLDEFSPRAWLQEFDLPLPETADPAVLARLRLSSSFDATAKLIAMDELTLQLDDTRLKGRVALLQPADPTYQFDLDIDQIDLDRYLPPTPEEDEQAAPESQTESPPNAGRAQPETPLFPVETLRRLKLDGRLRIDSLTVNKIKARAIQLKVTAKDGKLQLDEQIGRFYDGKIKGGVSLDVRGKSPKLNVTQAATQILAGPLLRDLTETDRLEGTGGFQADLSSTGQTVGQLKRGLNGNLSFQFKDGAVKGINLAKMLREAKAKLSGERIEVTNEPERTDFSELSGSAVINNGILNNRDLLAKSPFLRVDGAGKVNLVQEYVDYTIRPVLVSTPEGQGGKELQELVGVPVPVHLEGPWSQPKWRIDLAKVLQEQQKEKLRQKVDEKVQEKLPELQEKLPEELKDKLPGTLKGLF